jgi:hypothetical protein
MAVRIQLRRDISTVWNSVNPILAEGEIGLELDTDQFKVGNGIDPWQLLPYGGIQGPPGSGILSVDPPIQYDAVAKHLSISLTKSDVGLDQVDNTSDLDKPVSTAQQLAIDAGVTTAISTSNTYTDNAIAEVVDLAPELLDTLKEISDALGGDANFATTVNNAIDQKVSKSGDTMTGALRLVDLTTIIEEPAVPTLPEHAANKQYVDDKADEVNSVVSYKVDYIDLNALQANDQSVVLSGTPTQPSRVLLDVLDGGGAGKYVKDFIVSNDTLSWGILGGRFEGVLTEGDTLRIVWY